MDRAKWTKKEIDILKNNYLELGRSGCASLLNRSKSSIKMKVKRLNIQFNKQQILSRQSKASRKLAGDFNVNESLFIKNLNPYTSYLLGFIWADGHLYYKKRKSGHGLYRIVIGISKKDSNHIEKILAHTGKWSKTIVEKNGKFYSYFNCNNTILGEYLYLNDFKIKSQCSPNKILKNIPKKLQKYFILGYFDGDGCIHLNKKGAQIKITSTFDQDWFFLEKICKKINCNFSIERRIRKNKAKFSSFNINSSKNCMLFGSFLYKNSLNLGLKRKRILFKKNNLKIKEMISNKRNIWNNPKKQWVQSLF